MRCRVLVDPALPPGTVSVTAPDEGAGPSVPYQHHRSSRHLGGTRSFRGSFNSSGPVTAACTSQRCCAVRPSGTPVRRAP